MITIHKNGATRRVTKSAFREIFSPLGWKAEMVFTTKAPQEAAKAPGEAQGSKPTMGKGEPSHEPDMDSGGEETLDNMSDGELRQYASLLGVKTSGLKTRKDLIRAINSKRG